MISAGRATSAKVPGLRALCLLGLTLCLGAAAPAAAQDGQGVEPAGSPPPAGPVRIVPGPADGDAAPRTRRQQAPDAPGEVTVNLSTAQGLAVAAGTPLWIVDSAGNRLTACILERRIGDPRIICTSRSLP